MSRRYAVYFAPSPASLLWQIGCAWLGRDPVSGAFFEPPLIDDLTRQRYEEIVDSPRRYGFHATLKPPFALAPGAQATALIADLAVLASGSRPFVAPALEVSRIGGFLALTLTGKSLAIDHLCERCVVELDRFRAPPDSAELEARRKMELSERQNELLARWGYPYVLQEWQFHMTLTTRLNEPEISLVERHLRRLFRPVLAAPLYIDRIALFSQPDRESPFAIEAWFPLGG